MPIRSKIAHTVQAQGKPRTRRPRKVANLIRARAQKPNQAQRLATLGQLTIGVAHDFNNLLGIILGNLDLIGPGTADKSAKFKRWREALDAAQRGAALTRRLLALAQSQLPECTSIDVRELLYSAADIFRTAIGENVGLSLAIADDVWSCQADRSQLENALLNLVLNARDAMPRGGHIRVTADNLCIDGKLRNLSKLPAGQYVKLTVTDDGIGMSDETIEYAFEPFFTTKGNGKGNGVGLTMVYSFARQANGDAWIESRAGSGTSVHICLPRAQSEEIARPQIDQTMVRGSGQSILVVEDDRSLRLVATATIEGLGYEIFEASNGHEALEILERNPHMKILFTDILLPGGMNGVELAKEAQNRLPGLKVLYASGCADCESAASCSVQVNEMVLAKPFRAGDIARHLDALLQESLVKNPTC